MHDTHGNFDLTDRGLLLGDGVFDTAMVVNGNVFQREAHIERLFHSCEILGYGIDRASLEQHYMIDADVPVLASMRVTITGGAGPRGLAAPVQRSPNVIVSIAPLSKTMCFSKVRVQLSNIRRNETSPVSNLKSVNYLDHIVAATEARNAGYDDALLFNTQNEVACALVGNVFVILGHKLFTPPIEAGIIPGVIRGLIIKSAAHLGLSVEEKSMDADDLRRADGVFVTNSLRLLASVVSIGNCAISGNAARIQKALAQLIVEKIVSECGSCSQLESALLDNA